MKRRKFCGGWVTDPGTGGSAAIPPPELDTDPAQDAMNGRAHRPWAARNGMPEVRPYAWRPGEAEREAEIQERLARVRADLMADSNGDGGAP